MAHMAQVACSSCRPAFIIFSCAIVAPSHRRVVTLVTLGAGSVVALVLALATHALPEFIAAVVSGLLTRGGCGVAHGCPPERYAGAAARTSAK